MRSSLVAAGGSLLAAGLLFGSAAPAAAADWDDWSDHYPASCDLGVNDDTTYHHVTDHGVYAGTRDADGCKKKEKGYRYSGEWWERGWSDKGYGYGHDYSKDD